MNTEDLSFEYQLQYNGEKAELEIYEDFLQKINNNFQLLDKPIWELAFEKGFGSYYADSENLRIKLTEGEIEYKIRFHSYIKSNRPNFETSSYKNFGLIVRIYNRYFIENDRLEKLVVRKEIGDHKVKVYLTQDIEKYHDQLSIYGNEKIRNKVVEIKDKIEKYKTNGIFNLLSEDVELRGHQLAEESNHLFLQDILWSYKYLIIPSCPRESGGYEQELKNFLRGTSGKINYSDFKELNDGDKIKVECLINGKSFSVANLPQHFSFRFIDKLNLFLQEEYNTSFYIWNWERNPWEQRTFIYLKKHTIHEIVTNQSLGFEFTFLEEEIIDFYDENF